MEKIHMNKMDTWFRNLSPWRKGVGGQEKQRQLGDGWNKHRWEELIIDLADVEMIGSTWRETHRLKRIDMTISIVEKDWYSHRSMRTPFRKGMESTLDIEATRIPQLKTKQRIGLQNKPEQTYDRDFVRSFRGGAYTARSYSTIMYKAVHMTYEASPSRHSQGLFKTLRDHCKTNRG